VSVGASAAPYVSAVLWLLGGYHLAMGVTALLAPARATRIVRGLYGATLPVDDAFQYAVSMIGALALAMGALAVAAARAPRDHREIVAALIALQATRALCRVRDRRLLAESLGVSPARNWAAVLTLAVECGVMLLVLP
jgi:uncharacterized membrane protein HdeD (DUF308 family)